MKTIRFRLTVAYAAALIGTVVVFALTLLVGRKGGEYRNLTQHVYTEASLVRTVVRQAEQAQQFVTQTREPIVRTLLDSLPDYVFLLDSNGISLLDNAAVRQLAGATRDTVYEQARAVPTTNVGSIISTPAGRLLYVAASMGPQPSAVSRVVVASPTQEADFAVRELVGTLFVVLPLLILSSISIAYLIAGRALEPVDRIINEVQAISDGRSLHRRLPLADTDDEMGRLARTLNAMIERLETSFAGLRRFTADASHELKTPLAVLRADVERAMSQNATRTEKMVALEEALHETARMGGLVDSLLTLARADEGRFDLHREPIDLDPLVREVFETASILGESAGLDVSMRVLEPATVLGDPMRLRQLFLNVVTNAIKYTPRGGSVEISATCHERTAAFSVRDTGIGISAADLPHVFERFYRADRARSRSSERSGFGLGLAISQWIAEAHGGTISVRSRLTRGSTFTVTLPVWEEGAPG